MAAAPEQRLNPEERANLTAYIDGELTENESRVIATKLSLSPTARREVESLKKTWELLEYLPRPKASPVFSERTLTTALALTSRQGAWDSTIRGWMTQSAKGVFCVTIAALSLILGFLAMRWAYPDPLARQARDLSIVEHLDEYRDVGTFDFLEELARSKEFGARTPGK